MTSVPPCPSKRTACIAGWWRGRPKLWGSRFCHGVRRPAHGRLQSRDTRVDDEEAADPPDEDDATDDLEEHEDHHHHDVEQVGAAVVTVSSTRSLDDDPRATPSSPPSRTRATRS